MSPGLLNSFALGAPAGGGGTGYSGAVLADSPIAYYRLGEASGSTMADSSGNGRNGLYTGSPTLGVAGLVTGDANTAATFNGTGGQYAQNTWGSYLNVGTITLEAIIKPSSVSGARCIIDRDGDPGVRTFQYRLNGDKLEFLFWTTGGGPFFCTSGTSLSTGTKYHTAATFDGSSAKLYINGTLNQTLTQSGTLQNTNTNCPITVGATAQTSISQFFAGTLDECAVYGTALSGTRIAAHAALV